ncbi:Ubiquitin-conjugating enzyme E2 T [Lemmus lemmus]
MLNRTRSKRVICDLTDRPGEVSTPQERKIILSSFQLLLSEPCPGDPLMADIPSLFKYDKPVFLMNAGQWTEMHARRK